MHTELTARHGLTHDHQPLAVVDGLPGGCAELRPAQLRALAQALLRAADDCERHAAQRRPRRGELPPAVKRYVLG